MEDAMTVRCRFSRGVVLAEKFVLVARVDVADDDGYASGR
jgi:hypothetical protein